MARAQTESQDVQLTTAGAGAALRLRVLLAVAPNEREREGEEGLEGDADFDAPTTFLEGEGDDDATGFLHRCVRVCVTHRGAVINYTSSCHPIDSAVTQRIGVAIAEEYTSLSCVTTLRYPLG